MKLHRFWFSWFHRFQRSACANAYLKIAKGLCILRIPDGVTGKGANFHKDIREYLAAVKQTSAIPVMVGFGIRTAKDIEPFEDIVDGAIVGSNLLRILEESNYSWMTVKEYVSGFKKELNKNK